MESQSKYIITTVNLKDLDKGMVIVAYTGFSDRYELIDKRMCAFLQHNFEGAKAVVGRGGKKLEIPAENIRIGDSVIRIFSFPKGKKRLTMVGPKLVDALKARGIHSFKVRKPRKFSTQINNDLSEAIAQVNLLMKEPSRNKERLKAGVYNANQLVEKIKDSRRKRTEGASIIEQMMDNARNGKLNSSEIESFVDQVVMSTSSEAMMAIANLRSSDQTYSHCIDVGVLFQKVYFDGIQKTNRKSRFPDRNQALLGGFLHDFGKAKLPKELLDSTTRFETGSPEMELIRSHPFHGAKMLHGMEMPESIVNMSLTHHVKMDETLNTSYPKKLTYDDSMYESKLLAIVDIYQALVGRRSYKRSWTPPQAIRYLSALAGIEYDEQIWALFVSLLGEYPVGSLVLLNDESMGFVMSVPEDGEDLLRPQVAIVRDSYGDDLDNHVLLDLFSERDMYIKNDLDVTDVFDARALDNFANLKIVA